MNYMRRLLLICGAALVVSLCNVFIAQSTGQISDAASAGDMDGVTGMLLTLAGLTAAKILCSGISGYVT